jgi:hypothetical protein
VNNFFSLKRFIRLFIKQTTEHYRTYLMATAVLAGVMLLGGSFLFFIIPEPPDTGMQTVCFIILMLISGAIYTSTVFSDYGEKNRALSSVALPATAFEKFLVGWLYSYPIFMIVYTGVFYLVLIGLRSTRHWPTGHLDLLSLDQDMMPTMLTIYTLLHAISIFGAILFKRLHFIKTGFAFFLLYGVIMLLNTLFLKAITGVNIIKLELPYAYLNFDVGTKYYSLAAKTPTGFNVITALYLVAILIWIAAYFRLKEKQV